MITWPEEIECLSMSDRLVHTDIRLELHKDSAESIVIHWGDKRHVIKEEEIGSIMISKPTLFNKGMISFNDADGNTIRRGDSPMVIFFNKKQQKTENFALIVRVLTHSGFDVLTDINA